MKLGHSQNRFLYFATIVLVGILLLIAAIVFVDEVGGRGGINFTQCSHSTSLIVHRCNTWNVYCKDAVQCMKRMSNYLIRI